MFVNPYIFKFNNKNESVLVSLIGGGIQSIPSHISKLLFSNPEQLPNNYIEQLKTTEVLFNNPEEFYSLFNKLKSQSFKKTSENPLNVIFTLTYSCNFKCEYCFQLKLQLYHLDYFL